MKRVADHSCNAGHLAGDRARSVPGWARTKLAGGTGECDLACAEPAWARTSLVGGAGERDLSRIVLTLARPELAGGAGQHGEVSRGVPTWVRQGASR